MDRPHVYASVPVRSHREHRVCIVVEKQLLSGVFLQSIVGIQGLNPSSALIFSHVRAFRKVPCRALQ